MQRDWYGVSLQIALVVSFLMLIVLMFFVVKN
jgi:hypothetical protein